MNSFIDGNLRLRGHFGHDSQLTIPSSRQMAHIANFANDNVLYQTRSRRAKVLLCEFLNLKSGTQNLGLRCPIN